MSLAKFQIIKGLFWLILTVYHEARGESTEGQKNVVKIILNRAEAKSCPLENIVLARKQFSCYNEGIKSIKDTAAAAVVAANVYTAIDEWLEGNNLRGATHYYACDGPNKIPPPYWAKEMEVIGREGNHIFLKES